MIDWRLIDDISVSYPTDTIVKKDSNRASNSSSNWKLYILSKSFQIIISFYLIIGFIVSVRDIKLTKIWTSLILIPKWHRNRPIQNRLFFLRVSTISQTGESPESDYFPYVLLRLEYSPMTCWLTWHLIEEQFKSLFFHNIS